MNTSSVFCAVNELWQCSVFNQYTWRHFDHGHDTPTIKPSDILHQPKQTRYRTQRNPGILGCVAVGVASSLNS